MAMLRDAAYRAKGSCRPAPSRPATENEALTVALIVVIVAHIQNALVVFSLLSMVYLKAAIIQQIDMKLQPAVKPQSIGRA